MCGGCTCRVNSRQDVLVALSLSVRSCLALTISRSPSVCTRISSAMYSLRSNDAWHNAIQHHGNKPALGRRKPPLRIVLPPGEHHGLKTPAYDLDQHSRTLNPSGSDRLVLGPLSAPPGNVIKIRSILSCKLSLNALLENPPVSTKKLDRDDGHQKFLTSSSLPCQASPWNFIKIC